ncbi:endosialin [Rhinophrynus dorsalis]
MHLFILMLPLIIPLSSSRELGEQDALCGPGDSCYAIFYQRRGFLESWRACRERGGNLATVKNAEEAALIEQLLTSSTGSRGDSDILQLRLWIGLQRQPRQCAPQKPLRGFTWTTGDQDTAFTNWAQQSVSVGPQGSCSAPRCVAIGLGYGKPDDDFKWLEGSCTLPVDGFVCKFRYQGMCPALAERSVRYSVPFGYQGTWLDRLPFGSVAAVACEGQQQDLSVLCMLKEDGTVGWNKDEPLCQPPDIRQCRGCQQLCGEGGICACQEGYYLLPDGRSCELEEEMSFEIHDQVHGCPCQYQCVGLSGEGNGYQCICPEGYQLASDGHRCEDIDECEEGEEGPCEHSCQNAPGSYVCSCDIGFSISEDEPGHCVDIDECRIARLCQQMCVNYVGGFECFCSEGYELDEDRVSCRLTRHTEVRYVPSPPMTISEEGSEEEVTEWYQEEVDGRDEESYEPEWEMTGTTTGGREGRWDSSVHRERDYEWSDHVESWEDVAIAGTELIRSPTIAPFKKGWEEMISRDLTTDKQVGKVNSFVGWEDVISKTSKPTQRAPPVVTWENDRTTSQNQFQTISPSTAVRFTSVKIQTDKSNENVWSGTKETSGIHSAVEEVQDITTKPSWEMTKLSSTLAPTRQININSQATVGLQLDLDESLSTVPSSELPIYTDNAKVGSPVLATASPLPPQESKGKRDNRWLVVALLVPLCVFLVVMLALGIVYCTRCGGDTKPRSVTDCYNWVTGGGHEKGLPPTGVETPSCQPGV